MRKNKAAFACKFEILILIYYHFDSLIDFEIAQHEVLVRFISVNGIGQQIEDISDNAFCEQGTGCLISVLKG